MEDHKLFYYDLYAFERFKELQREIEQERLIAGLPRRVSFWRHGVKVFGQFLVAFGTRLERVEPDEQAVALIK